MARDSVWLPFVQTRPHGKRMNTSQIDHEVTLPPATARRSLVRWLLARWPAVLGLMVMAASLPIGSSGAELWPVLLIPVVVYLAAAAMAKPSTAWPLFGGVMVVLVVSRVIGVEEWRGLVMAALAFLVAGAVQGLLRPRSDLLGQSLLLLGLGGAAVAAVYVDVRIGAALVGVGLIAHGVCDVVLHHKDRVVPRSLSEFCAVLDFTLGLSILVLLLLP